jgi:hypothetical protein
MEGVLPAEGLLREQGDQLNHLIKAIFTYLKVEIK